ncbi:MAG: hypothetical protein KKB34_10380 [Bacteroidetes bacterium]|nr:hypothetical protein [Bacteroidota bacterium]
MFTEQYNAGTKEKSIAKDIITKRLELHKAIVKKMRYLNICTSETIVEAFKRCYLWDYHNVETSKALSLAGLNNAITMINDIQLKPILGSMLIRYQSYENTGDLLRYSQGQKNKIIAIAKYQLKIKPEALKKYAEATLERNVYGNNYHALDVTVNEAHQVIMRLEKWEAKEILKK